MVLAVGWEPPFLPCGLFPSIGQTRPPSVVMSRQWSKRMRVRAVEPLEAYVLELTECHARHTPLAKASQKPSPDSSRRDTDCTLHSISSTVIAQRSLSIETGGVIALILASDLPEMCWSSLSDCWSAPTV